VSDRIQGNGRALLAIKDAIVKQRTPKKQPTRNDLAQAWKIIRDQSEIIELQAKIRRQDRLSRTESKDRSLRQLKKSQSKKRALPSEYVN
jgi:hypothetical protein